MMQQYYLEAELNDLLKSDSSVWTYIQEVTLDGLWFIDLEKPGNEFTSPEFWNALGIDPKTDGSFASDWRDFIFPEDLLVLEADLKAHCSDPDHRYDHILRYHHVNGSTVWIKCRCIAITDKSGQPVRLLGLHSNITRVMRAEIEARAAWKAAQAADEELKSFAYSVSHDIKAPANTLDMLLKELVFQNKGEISEESQELITMCEHTVNRMRTLVEYVLDYTRVIQMTPEKEPVCLTDVAHRAVNKLSDEIEARDAEISIEPLPDVIAVPAQMDLLLYNLVSNAVKYCPKDRTPKVRVHAEDHPSEEMISVTVTDNGMGILAENQDRVFRLFQRLHGHNEIPGSGLGLPMSKRIAMNHQGTLGLVSSLEKGSAFSLYLPAAARA